LHSNEAHATQNTKKQVAFHLTAFLEGNDGRKKVDEIVLGGRARTAVRKVGSHKVVRRRCGDEKKWYTHDIEGARCVKSLRTPKCAFTKTKIP
jgi:hypothetical protein